MHADRQTPPWADTRALRYSATASAEIGLELPEPVLLALQRFAREHNLSIQEVVQLAVDFSLQSRRGTSARV